MARKKVKVEVEDTAIESDEENPDDWCCESPDIYSDDDGFSYCANCGAKFGAGGDRVFGEEDDD